MPQELKFELTEQAQRIISDLQTLPEWGLQAVARGMDQANQLTLARIQKEHLTGVGPFPPEEHRLGVVTNRLRSAAWASPAAVSGQTVSSAIGDNVVYAAIHEFGGVIHHSARSGKVRLRTNKHQAGGSEATLMRQNGYAFLAVFAKASHKNVREVSYEAEAYDVTMPARAPFRTGIEENAAEYGRQMSRALVTAWKEREQ